MDPQVIQEFYRFRKLKWVGPRYYAQPDGEDLPGKVSFCGQTAFVISGPIGVMNAYLRYPYPTSQSGRWFRVLRAVGPGVGMGLAFAVTTYYATRFREKDDFLNHSMGGIAAGMVLGAVNGLSAGFSASLVLAAIAGLLKYNQKELQTRKILRRDFPPYLKRNLDFSGIPELKGDWKKAEPPQK